VTHFQVEIWTLDLPNTKQNANRYIALEGAFERKYLRQYSDELRTGRPGFDFRQRQQIFLFSTASRPVLGTTHSPLQWVLGFLSPGVKRPGREIVHSPPSSAEVKNCGAIPALLIRLRGVVLNELSVGTTLLLHYLQNYFNLRLIYYLNYWRFIKFD
jgi:hypothetical protein